MMSVILILTFVAMVKRGAPETAVEKRNRLNTLGKEPHATARAVSKLCDTIRKEGLPEATSRSTLYRARKGLSNTKTPYGVLVETVPAPTKKEPNLKIGIQNPLAMMCYCALMSPTYAALLRATMEATPSEPDKPWSLTLYQDGIDPSDGLAKRHSRKGHIFYWAVKEYGMSALGAEQSWFTPAFVRDDVLREQPGGVPWLAQFVLRRFFDPEGEVAEIGGIDLDLHGGGSMTVYLKFSVLLVDGEVLLEACMGVIAMH